MKRVLLLVLLLVSLVELALERDRIYLLFSTIALGGLVRNGLTDRRRAQGASELRTLVRVNEAGDGDSACFSVKQVNGACTSRPHSSEDDYEKAEFTRQSAYTLSDGR